MIDECTKKNVMININMVTSRLENVYSLKDNEMPSLSD